MHHLSPLQNWTIFKTPEEVAIEATNLILKTAQQAIEERDAFHFVASGGTTPKRCYELLSEKSSEDLQWSKWHVYIGDERCLPEDDAERNSLMLMLSWLNTSPIPFENIKMMPAELGAEEAAAQYTEVVEEIDLFDCVMLGMGEDGHTASLFPHHVYDETADVVVEFDAPKPPLERVSLSFTRLSNSRVMIKLITGENKQDALRLWLDNQMLPINQVDAIENSFVLLDQAAMPVPKEPDDELD